ncbi:hypothetical protein BU16DRAFT_76737 [Lophium mytilinum]|uniref:Uncharacterized protein n=1 Tax=Lophium mytilinum TaxID=390894 RepID=A0A6A6QLH1_9PEZI|nr:hypothetical protein BU16DRAFT_76737 [Lophium mytilinum]
MSTSMPFRGRWTIAGPSRGVASNESQPRTIVQAFQCSIHILLRAPSEGDAGDIASGLASRTSSHGGLSCTLTHASSVSVPVPDDNFNPTVGQFGLMLLTVLHHAGRVFDAGADSCSSVLSWTLPPAVSPPGGGMPKIHGLPCFHSQSSLASLSGRRTVHSPPGAGHPDPDSTPSTTWTAECFSTRRQSPQLPACCRPAAGSRRLTTDLALAAHPGIATPASRASSQVPSSSRTRQSACSSIPHLRPACRSSKHINSCDRRVPSHGGAVEYLAMPRGSSRHP